MACWTRTAQFRRWRIDHFLLVCLWGQGFNARLAVIPICAKTFWRGGSFVFAVLSAFADGAFQLRGEPCACTVRALWTLGVAFAASPAPLALWADDWICTDFRRIRAVESSRTLGAVHCAKYVGEGSVWARTWSAGPHVDWEVFVPFIDDAGWTVVPEWTDVANVRRQRGVRRHACAALLESSRRG